MSPLRMPQHLSDPPHVDSGEAKLKFDLLEDIDAGLARSEREVERALEALREHDVELGDPAIRTRLLNHAADAVWRLFVQREAGDLADHQPLIERFGIPHEVLTRVGSTS
jgi:hypothetical protein